MKRCRLSEGYGHRDTLAANWVDPNDPHRKRSAHLYARRGYPIVMDNDPDNAYRFCIGKRIACPRAGPKTAMYRSGEQLAALVPSVGTISF
jgi:hypothetical protein